jgi:KaiC domain protein
VSDDEEEDWFERAMRETDEESDADSPRATADDDDAGDEDGDAGEEPADEDDLLDELAEEVDETFDEMGDAFGDDDEPSEGGSERTGPSTADGDGEDAFGGVADDESGVDESVEDDEDAFGGVADDQNTERGEDAFGGVADDEGDQQDPLGDPEGDGDPFGGGGGGGGFGGGGGDGLDAGSESDPFGGGGGGPAGGGEFGGEDDPFGGGGPGAGGGGGGMDFGDEGFGGGGGGGGPDFDEEELDSDIDRIDVGIDGLDEMILGGVPSRSLMVTIGSAGTGKTTFGLQFLTEGLENDEKAVYITLEESREAILSTAEEKGWPFREWRDEGNLAVVSMDPIEMANSLSSIRNDISRLVEEFDADRLVLDSVSLLEMMYDHPAKRRSEVFDFARSLKRAGVTTMLTSEASADDSYTSRYGIIEYLVDAVFILQYVRPSDFRETRLAVEIQKIRDANHSRETKPYEITNDGLSVYRQANIF